MALNFQRPNLPNLEQAPEATGLNAVSQAVGGLVPQYLAYKNSIAEQRLKGKTLDEQIRQFDITSTETNRHNLATEAKTGVNAVPNSFEGLMAADMKKRMEAGATLEEAVKAVAPLYREKLFPKVVSDPLGAPNLLTSEGPKPVFDSSGFNSPTDALLKLRTAAPKIANKFDEILDDSYPQKNQLLKSSVEAAGAASKVKSILLDPNPSEVGLASLGFHFARMSGSNSQLSDAERQQFEGPLSLLSRVVNKGYRLVAGDLSPQMREDLAKLSNVLESRSRVQAEKLLTAQKTRAQRTLGSMYNENLGSMFPTADSLIVGYDDETQQQAPAPQQTGPVEVKTKADYDSLPSGASYISNGKTYRKK